MFGIVLKVTACNIRLTYVFQDAHLKLSSLSGGHQDGEVGGCWAQIPPQIHQRYIYIWQYSYQKWTGNCQKQFSLKKKKKQLYLDLGRKAEAIMSRSMPLGGDTRGGGI